MTTTIAVYIVLLLTTTLYAIALSKLRDVLEPNLTWFEVVVGVTLVLLAPFTASRLEPGQNYEILVWSAFIVGGAPIICWQVGRWFINHRAASKERERLLARMLKFAHNATQEANDGSS